MGHVNQAEAMVRAVVTWGLLAEVAGHGRCLARGRVVVASLAAGSQELQKTYLDGQDEGYPMWLQPG